MSRPLLHERHLEIGSGYRPTPGFTHLDANPNAPGVDIVGSGYPLPAEACAHQWDHIRAVDVLEHFSYRDTHAVLRGWASVLKPGGTLFVQVPDAHTIMTWYCDNPQRLLRGLPRDLPQTALTGAMWRLLGGHADGGYARDGDDWRWNAHYAMFTAGSLTRHLERAGFDVTYVQANDHPNLLVDAVRP